MRNLFLILATVLAASATHSQVLDVDSEGQYVPLNEVDWLDLNNGDEAYPGYRRHIAAIGKDGKAESHWCYGTNIRKIESDEPGFEFAAGYCTIFDEDGDAYWTWFEVDGLGAFAWTVMGGTGKYKGARGSGVSTADRTMPDGTMTNRQDSRFGPRSDPSKARARVTDDPSQSNTGPHHYK